MTPMTQRFIEQRNNLVQHIVISQYHHHEKKNVNPHRKLVHFVGLSIHPVVKKV